MKLQTRHHTNRPLKGYTSLGGVKDTHPNPHLKKEQGKGDGFRPAYELMADDEERLGRDK